MKAIKWEDFEKLKKHLIRYGAMEKVIRETVDACTTCVGDAQVKCHFCDQLGGGHASGCLVEKLQAALAIPTGGKAMTVTLETLRQNLERIVHEAEQMCVDVQSWNDNRPDSPPFDCEFERLLTVRGRLALAAMARGDMKSFEWQFRQVLTLATTEANR